MCHVWPRIAVVWFYREMVKTLACLDPSLDEDDDDEMVRAQRELFDSEYSLWWRHGARLLYLPMDDVNENDVWP